MDNDSTLKEYRDRIDKYVQIYLAQPYTFPFDEALAYALVAIARIDKIIEGKEFVHGTENNNP